MLMLTFESKQKTFLTKTNEAVNGFRRDTFLFNVIFSLKSDCYNDVCIL